MEPEPIDIFCLAAWFIIPIVFTIWWIRMRLGLDKRWFVMPARAVVSSGIYFALPTAILGCVLVIAGALMATSDFNSTEALYLLYTAAGCLVLSYIFAYFEPNWLSPEWYRWLKEEHGDILPYLAEEAHQMGREEWLKRVETQEDLEQWVAELRRKHGM